MHKEIVDDINKDGIIDEKDEEIIQSFTMKNNQTLLAWTAMISIIIVSVFLFSPFVSNERINVLADLLQTFYISQSSIIGFFMGASTYLNVKNGNN